MKSFRNMMLTVMVSLALLLGVSGAGGAGGPMAVRTRAVNHEAALRAALDAAPAEASIVFAVPDMAGLSKKIAALGEALGINEPDMMDVLSAFKRGVNFTQGLRDDGTIMVVIGDLNGVFTAADAELDAIEGKAGAQHMPPPTPPIVLLVPVTDYAAFVGNLGGKANEAVTQVQMEGAPGFAKKIEGYAVLGPDQATVQAYQPAKAGATWVKNVGAAGAAYLASSDAVVLVNVEALGPKLRPLVARGTKVLGQQIERDIRGPMAALGPVVQWVMALYGQAGDALLRDTTAAMLGVDLSEKGGGISVALNFKAGSALAKIFKDGGATPGPLDLLPDNPYLFAGCANLQALDMKPMLDDLVAGAPKEMAWIGGLLKAVTPMLGKAQAQAQAYYLPPGGAMAMMTGMPAVNLYQCTDPAGFIKAQREVFEALNKLAPADGAAPAGGADDFTLAFKTSYTPEALTVDGVKADEYTMQVILPPALTRGNPMAMAMPTTTKGYIVASGNYVIMTTTPDAAVLKGALDAVKKGKGLGTNKGITDVRAEGLPRNLVADMYLSVGGVADLASGFLMMMGGPQLKAPADLPPVGMGVGAEQNSLVVRVYVPMAVVKFVKDSIVQVQAMGPGGMRPGRGPGNGPPPAPF